jgi:glyoxylase-like metal-dependent hydrolase (beta-lactamase superfamily II)
MEVFRHVFCPIEVNTYILSDGSGKCAIIDCGCYNRAEFDSLVDFLSDKKLDPVLLLNTHCHLDHIFGNSMLLEKYGIGSYCHRDEERNRKDSVLHASFFGLNMEPPPEPEGLIEHGQGITFGSVELLALHVPGHSPGGLAFYSKKDAVVFTGDALFAGSIGRSDLPGGDHETLLHSIKENLFTLPPETVVYPGHRGESTIGREMTHNPYFK